MEGAMESVTSGVPVVVEEEPVRIVFASLKCSDDGDTDKKTDNPSLPNDEGSEPALYAATVVLKAKLQRLKAMLAARREREDETPGSTDGAVVVRGSVRCLCGSRVNHRELLDRLRRLMKAFDMRLARRSYEMHRLGKEDLPAETDVNPNVTLLKGLVKRVITQFKSLNTDDHKSVVGNQQAINKLKQNGFGKEYSIFQSLHDARVSGQSDACSSELAKMFEKCHL